MSIDLTPEKTLAWICDSCGIRVGDSDGVIWCDANEASLRHETVESWEAAYSGAISAEDFLSLPELTRWLVLHRKCLPAPEVGPYGIEVERIRPCGTSFGGLRIC